MLCRNYELCRKFVDQNLSIMVGIYVLSDLAVADCVVGPQTYNDVLQSRTLVIGMGLTRSFHATYQDQPGGTEGDNILHKIYFTKSCVTSSRGLSFLVIGILLY